MSTEKPSHLVPKATPLSRVRPAVFRPRTTTDLAFSWDDIIDAPNRKERLLSGARLAHFEGFIHVEPPFGG